MKVQHIIGVDVSKKTIDLFCHLTRNHVKVPNSKPGFISFISWLKKQEVDLDDSCVVMEHTGLYSYLFEQFMVSRAIRFVKVPALEIIRSLGMVRGKTDKVDAARIALYGFEKQHRLNITEPSTAVISRLKMLHRVRSLLVRQQTALKCSIKEYENIGIGRSDVILKPQINILSSIEKQVEKTESEIDSLVKNNDAIYGNYRLLKSIRGIGTVTAVATIIKTENFTKFNDGRKFSCFCGTAPFEYSSGTSVKKKAKISRLGDKEMKTLLDNAARSAMTSDPELKDYYQRRLKEGKSKRSTINILRNKLIHRMFAVIKRQTPFTDHFLKAA